MNQLIWKESLNHIALNDASESHYLVPIFCDHARHSESYKMIKLLQWQYSCNMIFMYHSNKHTRSDIRSIIK